MKRRISRLKKFIIPLFDSYANSTWPANPMTSFLRTAMDPLNSLLHAKQLQTMILLVHFLRFEHSTLLAEHPPVSERLREDPAWEQGEKEASKLIVMH